MKQKVIRQTLQGSFTAFTFDVKVRTFFVKNFTEGDIYFSFANDNEEAGAFKIASGMGEEVFINGSYSTAAHYTKTLYVKGTGEVEVEALDF